MLWYIWGWCPLDFQDGIWAPSLCHVWQMVIDVCVWPVSDGQDGIVTRTAWGHISQSFCLNLKLNLGPWRWTLLFPGCHVDSQVLRVGVWEHLGSREMSVIPLPTCGGNHVFTIYGFKTIARFKQHSSMVRTGEDWEENVTLLSVERLLS